jgi:hypothetical protein
LFSSISRVQKHPNEKNNSPINKSSQTGGWTERQRDKQMKAQTYEWKDRQMDRKTDRQTDKKTNRKTDKKTNEKTDKWTETD